MSELPLILQIFTKEEQSEFKEQNDGNYRGPCPDCGRGSGGSDPFILFPENNSAFCHKTQRKFNLLELLALKLKYIKCIEGRQDNNEKSPIYSEGWDKELRESFFESIRTEFPQKVVEQIEEALDTSLDAQKIDNEVSINENIVDKKEPLNFDLYIKLLSDINDLPNFGLFDKALGLTGEAYLPFKKSLWYFTHSLTQPELSYEINHKTKIDNRKHMLIITPPAGGKTTTKQFTKSFVEKGEYIEASGISNPEQLVGKTIYKKDGNKKKPVENRGILGFKLVLYDEAQQLINEGMTDGRGTNEIYAKSQRLKRLAMDIYGDNIISKKLVDDTKDDMLSYPSPSRIIDFAHPKKLESPFFDTGSFRRYEIFNLTSDTEINLTEITDFKIEPNNAKEEYFNKLFTEEIKDLKYETKFNQQTLDIISYSHKVVLNFLLNHKNENAFRYGLLSRYSLRTVFCKNVYVLALSKGEKESSFETAITACCDSILFILKSIEAINELGDIGASTDMWHGLQEPDILSLMFLLKKKTFSPQTSEISIKKFWTLLCHFYGCKISQARKHYYRLKNGGYIDSTQTGKHNSRVWLTYIPKDVKLNSEGFDSISELDKIKGDTAKNSVLTPLKSLINDEKTFEKIKGDKGDGILALYIIRAGKYHQNKNKNKYIYEGGNKTPLPPLNVKDYLQTTKDESKGVIVGEKQSNTLKHKKTDREVQFYEAKECKNIVPNHTVDDVLFWLKDNHGATYKQIYDRFGVGSLRFKNELLKSKKIIKEGDIFFVESYK
jgi:hypothetical protein